ncbi:TlpA family protein disulfide reductase [Fontimonas thermophila]|nr:TlpA disulfide reductase family protein [Fontimonas thermophila]
MMGVHRWLPVLLLALLALPPAVPALERGDVPPPLVAPQQDGTPLSLATLRGQLVYVDFWASWCAPCAQALPALETLYRKYRDRGFTVLAVNVDTQRKAALAMLARIPVSYPVVFDPEGHWPGAFGLRGMPCGYLLDRDGRIVYIQTGYRASDLPALEAAIVAALGE